MIGSREVRNVLRANIYFVCKQDFEKRIRDGDEAYRGLQSAEKGEHKKIEKLRNEKVQ